MCFRESTALLVQTDGLFCQEGNLSLAVPNLRKAQPFHYDVGHSGLCVLAINSDGFLL